MQTFLGIQYAGMRAEQALVNLGKSSRQNGLPRRARPLVPSFWCMDLNLLGTCPCHCCIQDLANVWTRTAHTPHSRRFRPIWLQRLEAQPLQTSRAARRPTHGSVTFTFSTVLPSRCQESRSPVHHQLSRSRLSWSLRFPVRKEDSVRTHTSRGSPRQK